MTHNPYIRFRGQNLTLNDYLAIDRTTLANERTFLAYARTALALAVVGATGMKFLETWWLQAVGVVFMLAGVVLALRGWQRFIRTKQLLAAALTQETGVAEHPLADEVSSAGEKAAKPAVSEKDPRPN